MTSSKYYSVQTLLAFMLQSQILKNFRVYVAVEFNPKGNDPTSRPFLIAQAGCRLAARNGTADDLAWWENLKNTLDTVVTEYYADGEITRDQLLAGKRLIAGAELFQATPVLLIVPHSDTDYKILSGDAHVGFETTEEEYVLADLKPEYNFERYHLNCATLDDETLWYWDH